VFTLRSDVHGRVRWAVEIDEAGRLSVGEQVWDEVGDEVSAAQRMRMLEDGGLSLAPSLHCHGRD